MSDHTAHRRHTEHDQATAVLEVSGVYWASSKDVGEAVLSRQPGVVSVDANPTCCCRRLELRCVENNADHSTCRRYSCRETAAGQAHPRGWWSTFVSSLMNETLIDELRLTVIRSSWARAKMLFKDVHDRHRLELGDLKRLPVGRVGLTYGAQP